MKQHLFTSIQTDNAVTSRGGRQYQEILRSEHDGAWAFSLNLGFDSVHANCTLGTFPWSIQKEIGSIRGIFFLGGFN